MMLAIRPSIQRIIDLVREVIEDARQLNRDWPSIRAELEQLAERRRS